eukprot:670059-Pyramimonas_sp.AAC.1
MTFGYPFTYLRHRNLSAEGDAQCIFLVVGPPGLVLGRCADRCATRRCHDNRQCVVGFEVL